MPIFDLLVRWIFLLLIVESAQASVFFNPIEVCANASWSSNGVVFANRTTVGQEVLGIFIDKNDTVYVPNQTNRLISIWMNADMNKRQVVSGSPNEAWSIFVTSADDIFVDNGVSGRVDKWSSKSLSSISAMTVSSPCAGLFVDINANLYCSLSSGFKVIRVSLNDATKTIQTVAGTGVSGSTLDALKAPRGIFVDTNFNLYVADYGNKRIHLFEKGQTTGKIVAGNGAPIYSQSIGATGVVVGTNDRLYIVDNDKHQIVESSSNGIRCLVGCSGGFGAGLHQLHYPYTVAFDSLGNMFVSDQNNHRILKFNISTEACNKVADKVTTVMSWISTKQTGLDSTVKTPSKTTTTKSQSTEEVSANLTSTIISSTSGQNHPTSETTEEFLKTSQRSTDRSSAVTSTINTGVTAACYPPTITLDLHGSTLNEPIDLTRKEYLYTSSTVKIVCTDSFSTTSKWIIHSCRPACIEAIQLFQWIMNTSGEFFLPPRTLDYGLYEIKLTVTVNNLTHLSTEANIYLNIIRSKMIVRLIPSAVSLITHYDRQDLKLDPGTFSIDPDFDSFNASEWFYTYYCGYSHEFQVPIENLNHSCFSGVSKNTSLWQNEPILITQSFITIPDRFLASNTIYQFMVELIHRKNGSFRAIGYLSVQVEDSEAYTIAIDCVIPNLCFPSQHRQTFVGSTQLALHTYCLHRCPSTRNIQWKIYQGLNNSSNGTIRWLLLTRMIEHDSIDIFGTNSSRLTATKSLFERYSNVLVWKFEVTYVFPTASSQSAIEFIIHRPSVRSSCTIHPLSGTTATLFNVHCLTDRVNRTYSNEYSIDAWKIPSSERLMIAFSNSPTIQIRLPSGDEPTYMLHIIVNKRDQFGFTELIANITVEVKPDYDRFDRLVHDIESYFANQSIKDSGGRWISTGHINSIAQEITSMTQLLNKNNSENIDFAIQNGIPPTSVCISPLKYQPTGTIPLSFNMSIVEIYEKTMNSQSRIRDDLMAIISNLRINRHLNSIKLQASIMGQLTIATNQLTQKTLILASLQCNRLASELKIMATDIPSEEVKTIAADLVQCAANLRTATNRITQQRGFIFDKDRSVAQDDDEQLKFDTNRITNQVDEIYSKLTVALELHLNVGQHVTIDNQYVFFSLEKLHPSSVENKTVESNDQIFVRFSPKTTTNQLEQETFLLRTVIEPLASRGDGVDSIHNRYSRALSLSLYDQHHSEVSIRALKKHPVEFFIPRDQTLRVPPMIRQNVTNTNNTSKSFPFKLHLVNLTKVQPNKDLPVSLHIEINPLNTSIAYLFIFKMDRAPNFGRWMKEIDGWTILCPSNLTNDDLYTYYIDNRRTSGHRSIIFGLRELNSEEQQRFCFHRLIKTDPPVSNEYFSFSFDYQLRTFVSGCYYLDEHNYWQADGLLVGPLTNHNETHCISI